MKTCRTVCNQLRPLGTPFSVGWCPGFSTIDAMDTASPDRMDELTCAICLNLLCEPVNCTLDASPGNRTACHLRSSRTAFRRAAAPRDSTNSTRPFPLHHESPALVARPRPHSNFACSLDARAGSGCTFSLLSAPLNGPIPTRTIPNAPTSTLLYHGLGGEGGEIRYRIASVLYPFSTES